MLYQFNYSFVKIRRFNHFYQVLLSLFDILNTFCDNI